MELFFSLDKTIKSLKMIRIFRVNQKISNLIHNKNPINLNPSNNKVNKKQLNLFQTINLKIVKRILALKTKLDLLRNRF